MSVVLITGSCGLVGSESVKFFASKGFDVIGIDNNCRKFFFGPDGDISWMHVSMISNKRTFINREDQNLLKYKNNNIVNAIVKKGVVGKIINCDEIFCKVKIKNYKGWVEKKYLWGIKKN